MAAVRWSGEHVATEFRDLQASCMAVDCTGQYALLASKRAIAAIDLNEPHDSIRKVTRQSKWEVNCLQCSPHESNSRTFVLALNQLAEVMVWEDSHVSTTASLKGHTRVICDLDWSPFDANTVATCSADTFTFIWDIRDTRKPSISLKAVDGTSQVRWNKVSSNLLATAHDTDIRIWDPRKQNTPVQYIAGHLSKIHGLDWNPHSEYHLASSSQDCTVKFWDCTGPKKPEATLSSSSPVWRARYTPFGQGLVTVVVPQLRRGENSLLLWDTEDLSQPRHTFVGHTDVVLEFQWRKKLEGNKDYQLVTWSRDQSLRIWRIEPSLQKLCGHDTLDISADSDGLKVADESEIKSTPCSENEDNDQITFQSPQGTPPNHSTNTLSSSISPQQPRTLHQEFSLVNLHIPNVTVDELDPIERTCTVSAFSGKHHVTIIMTFPPNYPYKAAPNFQIIKSPINKALQTKLIKVLKETSLQHVKRNRSCLEPCLRILISTLDSFPHADASNNVETPYNLQPGPAPSMLPLNSYGSFQDASIPFPRTSGARFSGAGYLVHFVRPRELSHKSGGEVTPRSLSALCAFAQQSTLRSPGTYMYGMLQDMVSITNFYQRQKSSARPKPGRSRIREDGTIISPSKKVPKKQRILLTIYDISCLLPINKQLAETYVIDNQDVPSMCNKNAAAAAAVGRKDLIQMWSLIGLTSNPILKPSDDPDLESPWGFHPFGRKLLTSFMEYYSQQCDVQTLAILCCAFSNPEEDKKRKALISTGSANSLSQWDVVPDNNSELAFQTSEPGYGGWPPTIKIRRSNSSSDLSEDYQFDVKKSREEQDKEKHEEKKLLLNPNLLAQYDQFKLKYADILYKWGLVNRRAEVLKYCSVTPEAHKGIEFLNVCHYCGKQYRGSQCGSCKKYGFQCSVCHIPVKGSSNFCLACGHGGHTCHMWEWFKKHNVCPTGCGCSCLKNNPIIS